MSRATTTKEKLQEVALDLIWRNSYGATSVDHICAAAGVVKGSFYHAFKSKSELAVAALDAEWKNKQVLLNEIFSPVVPPLERFERVFKLALEKQTQLKQDKGCVCGCPWFSLGSEMGTQDEAIRQRIENAIKQYTKYYEAAIRDAHSQGLINAPDAVATTKLIMCYTNGAMMEARVKNDLAPVAGLYEGVKEILGVSEPVAA